MSLVRAWQLKLCWQFVEAQDRGWAEPGARRDKEESRVWSCLSLMLAADIWKAECLLGTAPRLRTGRGGGEAPSDSGLHPQQLVTALLFEQKWEFSVLVPSPMSKCIIINIFFYISAYVAKHVFQPPLQECLFALGEPIPLFQYFIA